MKLGAENRKQMIVLASLGGVALLLVLRAMLGSGAPQPTTIQPVASMAPTPSTPSRSTRSAGRNRGATPRSSSAPHSIDPSLRYDWLKSSEDMQYAGNGRNIFMAQAEIPTPVSTGAAEAAKADQGPPPPPPPPPINLKFYGFASGAGQPKRIFLSQGEDVFIASEGEVIDRRYRIVRISPMSVEIEDMLNNNRQSIPLTQG
jgi:hypothetical protein